MTLEQAKARALEYLDRDDLINAVASMASDYGSIENKKPDPHLMMIGMMAASSRDSAAVRRWIEGFN
jgi:hypothetical protein